MMVVRGEKTQLEQVQDLLDQAGAAVQSKNVFSDTFELVYELQLEKQEEEKLVNRISKLEGMKAAVWIPQRCDYRNANNNSVVLRFEYGQNSFLLTGDMEYGEEAAYLQSGEVQKTDILKLGRHGENDATSAAFLKKVKPAYGLITGNEEENPESVNPEIEARLDAFDVECFFFGKKIRNEDRKKGDLWLWVKR